MEGLCIVKWLKHENRRGYGTKFYGTIGISISTIDGLWFSIYKWYFINSKNMYKRDKGSLSSETSNKFK